MKYVIAARYNSEGKRITEGAREEMVLDSPAARKIVAGLNRKMSADRDYRSSDSAESKAGDWL